MLSRRPRRPAATAVECAVIFPASFLLTLGLVVGALGIFRYQQVASLAREGARWASVHGRESADENGVALTTAADVYNNAIAPMAVLLDLNQLSYAVGWDDAGQQPVYLDPQGKPRGNRVRVTVTYQWVPEAYLGGLTLTSTSEMPLSH